MFEIFNICIQRLKIRLLIITLGINTYIYIRLSFTEVRFFSTRSKN